MKNLLYSKIVKQAARLFFSLFYEKKYLSGYYFDVKRMGWFWAWRGLRGRFGINRKVPYPVHPNTVVSDNRVHFDSDDLHIFQTPGCYWQVHDADIYVGKGTYIAPNVGLITTNHDPENPDRHLLGKEIRIGEKCWIGMNAVILPGVVLGEHTIVGAGAVVTKSFPDGYAVVGGNPAKLIRRIPKEADLESTE